MTRNPESIENPKSFKDRHSRLLLKYLSSKQGEMLAFLRQLVSIETPSSVPEAQTEILDLLAETFLDTNCSVDLIQGTNTGGHLVARFYDSPPGAKEQLLLGHCDTVWPLGTITKRPFVLKGNVAEGPGVFDMKAGITQMIFALKAILELELVPEVRPVVFVNSDEEIGSIESESHIISLAQEVERTFVVEPALGLTGKLKTRRKGVGNFKVDVQGSAAHAGLDPEKGASAILALSYVIQQLFALNDLDKGISVNVGTIEGGLRPNVIAPESSASVDVRVSSNADAINITEKIMAIGSKVPGTTVTISGGFTRRPLEKTPANKKLWMTALDLSSHLGLTLEEGMAGGGSDGNLTSQFTATLDGLGAVGDGAHANHEFVLVDMMPIRAALLAMLILSPSMDADT